MKMLQRFALIVLASLTAALSGCTQPAGSISPAGPSTLDARLPPGIRSIAPGTAMDDSTPPDDCIVLAEPGETPVWRTMRVRDDRDDCGQRPVALP